MKIEKYKKNKNGKYNIIFEDKKTIDLYEDVILKYNLLLKKEITEKDLVEIDKYNQECDVYYVALNSLKSRYKSVYEMKEYLRKKEFPSDLIDKAINKLVKQGYLDDRNFAKSYINSQIVLTNKGPYKIKKELSDKKISDEIINQEIVVYEEDEQKIKINKVIDKLIKSNHSKGGIVLKQKIISYLKNLGYSTELIMLELDKKEIVDDESIRKKEYDKLYRKLSKKYSGKELDLKLKEKLFQKGFYYEN